VRDLKARVASSTGQGPAALLLFSIFVGTAFPGLRAMVILAVLASLALAFVSLREPGFHKPSGARLPALVIAAAALSGAQLLEGQLNVLTPAFVAVAVVATLEQDSHVTRAARLALPLLITGLAAWMLTRQEPDIDVHVFLTDGVRALFAGHDPYAITFPNIYGPELTAQVYGPGEVQDGRLTFGFPYPPLLLLTAVPGYLLGDVRLSSVLAVAAVGALMLARSNSISSRRAAVLFMCLPGIPSVFASAWVEPIVVALLAVVVLAARRGHWMVGAIALGLLFASKQYFVVVVPCLWLLRPYATRARVLAFVATGSAVTAPFIAWNPAAWWDSVVALQFRQPFRPDSISIVAELAKVWSWADPTWAGPLSLVVGFGVAVLLAKTLRPGVTEFSLALGLCLAATFLLSKQSFLNYYFICAGALVLAAWSRAMDSADPTPSSEPATVRSDVAPVPR
jgi:hypothetical protein